LKALGWDVLVIWECEIREKGSEELLEIVREFLDVRISR